MFPLIEGLLNNPDKTNEQFCIEQGITQSVLYYWMRKFREEQSGDKESSAFVKVNISGKPATQESGIEVVYPDGTRLRLGNEVKTSWLRELIPVFVKP